ncbi:hypothetical protein K7432_016802 [Basidiobolus ranarum]|uniref:Uncharacterized protein n=1 Tax=Basidiobolus ranarum TaxID=34480 RepID=A0ABR2WE84_9FUNG
MAYILRGYPIPIVVIILQCILYGYISFVYYNKLPDPVPLRFEKQQAVSFQTKQKFFTIHLVTFYLITLVFTLTGILVATRLPARHLRVPGKENWLGVQEKEKLVKVLSSKYCLWITVFTAQFLLELNTLLYELSLRKNRELFWFLWVFLCIYIIEVIITTLIGYFKIRSIGSLQEVEDFQPSFFI